MQDARERFASNLAAAIERSPLTQAQIAERLNVTQQAVSSWQRGLSSPNIENLDGLAEVLEVEICAFFREVAA